MPDASWPAVVAGDDWADDDARTLPRAALGFAVSALALAALFAYDYAVVPAGSPLVADWFTRPTDWLALLAATVLVWAVGPALVRNPARTRRYWLAFRRDPVALASGSVVAGFVAVGALGPLVLPTPHYDLSARYQPPAFLGVPADVAGSCVGPVRDGVCYGTLAHPLGTAPLGYDMLLLTAWGAHTALVLAVIVAAVVAVVATAVGTTAAVAGGRVDALLTRYVDLQETVPAFLVYLVVLLLANARFAYFVAVFALLSWGGVARTVRSAVRSARQERYAVAARAAGASRFDVAVHHLVPAAGSSIAAGVSRQVALLLLVQAAVGFLGLNETSLPTWGQVVSTGFRSVGGDPAVVVAWWVAGVPVAALALTVVSLSLAGNAVSDRFAG
ncbi:hypothetical protein GCM10009039_01880 [Halocalculus aciditolerans]|uniref:ABC transmembrane type-1 domain-containing protein n=2 Tax=Halocalculus aciditolerans TaxID=1383812 RepID=A0A830EZX9_9EURY|nr:hypothetical protein GCM10009039_01880 [Halocalculus aciditolerans]